MFTLVKLSCLLFIGTLSRNDTLNQGQIIIEKNLLIVKNYAEGKLIDTTGIRGKYISFFAQLTSISSEAPCDYGGQLDVTMGDYKRWKAWYVVNKKDIFWDGKLKKVMLLKKISPPDLD